MIHRQASTPASSCSDLREVNEAQVAHIISYLDSVDDDCVTFATLPPTVNTSNSSLPLSSSSRNSGRAVFQGLKETITALRATQEDLRRRNERLTQELEDEKVFSQRRIAKLQDVSREELLKLREEVKLLSNAKHRCAHELQEARRRCDAVTVEKQQQEATHSAEKQRLMEAQAAALSEVKGKMKTQEKAKREQWSRQEAKRIKESTLRAVEPDIALLLNRHKAEMARVEEEHRLALGRKDEELVMKDRYIQSLRATFSREAEELVTRERELLHQRSEDEQHRHTKALQAEKSSFAEAKNSMERFFQAQQTSLRQEIGELEHTIQQLRHDAEKRTHAWDAALAEGIRDAMKEREAAFRTVELKRLDAHRQAEAKRENEYALFLKEKEEEILRKCEEEKEKQIAAAMLQWDQNHHRAKREAQEMMRLQQETASRREREVERLNGELQLVTEQLRAAQAALLTQNKNSVRAQQEVEALKSSLLEKEEGFEAVVASRLGTANEAWEQRLQRVEREHGNEKKDLLQQQESERQRYEHELQQVQMELRTLEQRHSTELCNLNGRIMASVAKKDAQLQLLTEKTRQLEAEVAGRDEELERHRQLISLPSLPAPR